MLRASSSFAFAVRGLFAQTPPATAKVDEAAEKAELAVALKETQGPLFTDSDQACGRTATGGEINPKYRNLTESREILVRRFEAVARRIRHSHPRWAINGGSSSGLYASH